MTLAVYDDGGKPLGSLRASIMQMVIEPKSEDQENKKPQSRYSGYATTSANGPVFEVPAQAVTDLENTISRLRSDVNPSPAAQPKATSAHVSPTPMA